MKFQAHFLILVFPTTSPLADSELILAVLALSEHGNPAPFSLIILAGVGMVHDSELIISGHCDRP